VKYKKRDYPEEFRFNPDNPFRALVDNVPTKKQTKALRIKEHLFILKVLL
jgi:hypothetical protein